MPDQKYKGKDQKPEDEGRSVDECLEEIFSTHKNEGNAVAWRLKKHKFYAGILSDHGKQAILKEFGYQLVSEALYNKPQEE